MVMTGDGASVAVWEIYIQNRGFFLYANTNVYSFMSPVGVDFTSSYKDVLLVKKNNVLYGYLDGILIATSGVLPTFTVATNYIVQILGIERTASFQINSFIKEFKFWNKAII